MANVVLQTIAIQYDTEKDRFTYDPPYVAKINTGPTRRVSDQPQICFECKVNGAPQSNFAVHFVGPCPLKHVRCRTTTGSFVEDIVVGGTGGAPGTYHYFVAVLVEGNPHGDDGIYTDDPDIMVW